jgi:Protein of unknown function (DUF4242)
MTSPPSFEGPASAFLVERYLPATEVDGLADSVARVARLCADPARAGVGVEYLHSAYLPTEDTCFCLFRAPSSDAVRAVNNEGHFALDRITDAVLHFPVELNT